MADINYIGHVIKMSFTGLGDSVDHIIPASLFHSVQVIYTPLTTDQSFSVSVNGSLDNIHFDPIDTAATSADILTFQGVYRYLSFTVNTLSTGDKIDILYAGT